MEYYNVFTNYPLKISHSYFFKLLNEATEKVFIIYEKIDSKNDFWCINSFTCFYVIRISILNSWPVFVSPAFDFSFIKEELSQFSCSFIIEGE